MTVKLYLIKNISQVCHRICAGRFYILLIRPSSRYFIKCTSLNYLRCYENKGCCRCSAERILNFFALSCLLQRFLKGKPRFSNIDNMIRAPYRYANRQFDDSMFEERQASFLIFNICTLVIDKPICLTIYY